MNELQLKQAIFEALKYADIYNAFTVISVWGILISLLVTAVLLISKYTNYFENNMKLDEPIMRHLDFMSKLSVGTLIACSTLACILPSKDSKISEAEAYISQLEDTPKNRVYIKSLSQKYSIQPPTAQVEPVANEVVASQPAVEKNK